MGNTQESKNLCPKDKITLDELDELSSGVGSAIYRIIERPGNFASMADEKRKVEKLLEGVGLTTQDVFIERGMAEGLTISEAYINASRVYQFRDQFG